MEESNENKVQISDNTPNQKGSKATQYILIGIILLLAIAVGYFMINNNKLKDDNSAQLSELVSTSSELEKVSLELENKIQEIEKLGGDISELERVRDEIQQEKEKLSKSSKAQLASLKRRVSGYRELLKNKDEEIIKLKEVNQVLLTQNTDLKEVQNNLEVRVDSLKSVGVKLQSKVAKASQLRVENIQVLGTNARGKERMGTLRSRQIDKVKVKFKYVTNDVAPVKSIQVMIRLLDPKGQVLFDVAKGAGTFMLNGKEEFYTLKKEVLFDNSNQEIVFEYEQTEEYAPGKYRVEIITDDYISGSQTFNVK